ncbi:MAG TPA: TlpA disulfide reductase family protein [bacterium]|nr:TlpA disulfide reductase family protein [bacterium]
MGRAKTSKRLWPALVFCLWLAACQRPSAPLSAGRVAPDFRANDLTGRTVYLNAELKKPVVLTFFATWCAPCRDEMPLLSEVQQRFAGRVTVLCVVVDPENADRVRSMAAGMATPYPFLLDEGQGIMQAYGVQALPATFVIGVDGRIHSSFLVFGEVEKTALTELLTRLTEG